MVFLRSVLYKKNIRQHFKTSFIDSLRLKIKGGFGGNGVPKYGGVGGQGGCVYFVAKDDVTLRNVSHKFSNKRINAKHGEDASKHRILGRRGDDVCVEVPTGISIIDDQGKLIGDLNEDGAKCLGAGGGTGGCSGNSFLGKPGHVRTIKLDLKLIADVGLVGFPNAGKSTLLKAISNAYPKIASYPFTTIRPQLGILEYSDLRQISMADLPGLIEGAHANIGLGHKFLKHVERTRLLLLVVDIFGFQLSHNHKKRNCLENVFSLNKELELYDSTLLDKPCMLLVNKMDVDGSIEEFVKIENILNNLSDGLKYCPPELHPTKLLDFQRVIPISAKNIKEIDKVKQSIRDVLDTEAEKLLEEHNNEKDIDLIYKLNEKGPKVN